MRCQPRGMHCCLSIKQLRLCIYTLLIFGVTIYCVLFITYTFIAKLTYKQHTVKLSTNDNDVNGQLTYGNMAPSHDNKFVQHCRKANILYRTEHKYLVYKCDTKGCGGLGDRQRAIVTTFLLSLLMNRTFGIDITYPCGFENSFEPSLYDCTRYKSFLWESGHLATTITLHNVEQLLLQNHTDNMLNLRQNVVYLKTREHLINTIRHISILSNFTLMSSWLRSMPNHDVIRHVLNALFKPTSRLSNDVVKFMKENQRGPTENRIMVCSHIRVGNNPTIPTDSARRDVNLTTIFQFLENFNDSNKYNIYIATDSEKVKREAKFRFRNLIYIDREIVHISRFNTVQDSCEGLYTAVLEQTILSKCDILLLTKSGFGQMAACLRGTSNQLYMFKVKNNVDKIRLKFYN